MSCPNAQIINQGSLNMVAGEGLRVSSNDVAAAQDINLIAKRVTFDEGHDMSQSKLVTKMEQDAFDLLPENSPDLM